MKIVYVVSGSEDGLLGVFGNKKSAYEEGVRYLKNQNLKIMSYQQVCKELKNYYDYDIDLCDYNEKYNVTIRATLFNRKDRK